MSQFDVYQQKGRTILLLDCQNDYLDHLTTRFVIPLIPMGRKPPSASRLNPILAVDGIDYVLTPNAAATITVAHMGKRIGSLAIEQDVIKAAIDQLVTGF